MDMYRLDHAVDIFLPDGGPSITPGPVPDLAPTPSAQRHLSARDLAAEGKLRPMVHRDGVPPTPAQRAIVRAAFEHAIRSGARLGIVIVRFTTHSTSLRAGECFPLGDGAGARVFIDSMLVSTLSLPRLLMHELWHASDYHEGVDGDFDAAELELRAETFAEVAFGTWSWEAVDLPAVSEAVH
jgi:hypothetical protein